MSRTPIREALARLATEGYIQPAAGRGYVIVKLTAQDLINVYLVRAELEGLAAAEAAKRIGRVDLARLEDLYDEMSVAAAEDRDKDLALLNSNFHATIAEISGNSYLKTMLDDIRNIFDRYRPTALTVPGRREYAHGDHGQMIEALRRQDSKAARKLAEDHVREALATRQSALPEENTG
jgi:DNA-binding GntR family transcriptional regulator